MKGHKDLNILLLTASINPIASNTPLTQIIDPKERLNQYISNMKRIIFCGAFNEIIFCENTNYSFDYSEIIALAESKGIKLEILVFAGNYKKIGKLGKGYGEGEIIKYAIEHSKLLKPDSVFYKLTGRIFVRNIKRIVSGNANKDTIFIRAQRHKQIVDARLFKVSVAFFKQHLLNEFEKVNDLEKNYLEMVYFQKLHALKKIDRFSEFPYFVGVSGSTGEKYDQSTFEYLKYSLLLKTGFLNVN